MEASDVDGINVAAGSEGSAEIDSQKPPIPEEKDASTTEDKQEKAATESSDESNQENSPADIVEAVKTENSSLGLVGDETSETDSISPTEGNTDESSKVQIQNENSTEDSEYGEETVQSESSETESKDEHLSTEDNLSQSQLEQPAAASEDVTQAASNGGTSDFENKEEPEAFQSSSNSIAESTETVKEKPAEYSELTEADQDSADGMGKSESFENIVDVEEALDSPLTSTSPADSDQELDLAESVSVPVDGGNSLQDSDLLEGATTDEKHTRDQQEKGKHNSSVEPPMEEISLDDVQEEEGDSEPTQLTSPLEGCERTILRTEVEPEHTGSSVNSVSEGEDALLSELDAALQPPAPGPGDTDKQDDKTAVDLPNGLRSDLALTDAPEDTELKVKFETLLQSHTDQALQLQRLAEDLQAKTGKLGVLTEEKDVLKAEMKTVVQERDTLKTDLQRLQSCATNEVHATRIRQLEASVLEHQKEVATLKEKLGSHDAAAKRAITTLQREMGAKVSKAQQLYEDSIREKESMVIKYAKSESQLLDLTKINETLERRLKDALREREGLVTRLKQFHAESQKVRQQADNKESEVSARNKEMEKLKEEMNSHIIKVRWSQNKLKTETEAHRETKAELEKMRLKLKEAKEESEQIRRNCQEMIKTYQDQIEQITDNYETMLRLFKESEEVKSVSLDKQLKEKETQLMMQEHQRSEEKEVLENLKKELDALKQKYKSQLSENNSLKTKVACYEEERQKTEGMVRQYKDALGQQKLDNIGLQEKMRQLEELQEQLHSTKQEKGQFQEQVRELRSTLSDQEASVTTSRAREQELLVFTEKLTAKNTQLTTENNTLQAKVDKLTSELKGLKQTLEELKTEKEGLSKDLTEERDLRCREADLLTQRLSEKARAVEQLTIQIEDQKDEIKTLKRKHQQGVKDLTRQLQQAKKKLEAIEASQAEGKELSSSSRASSCTSLDKVTASNGMAVSSSPPVQNTAAHASSEEDNVPTAAEQEDPYPNIDKSVLVERILKLQKAHARKNEKLEFMEDHITQMIDEVKKKTKIIQMYVMREEAGTLSTEFMDDNKARMARKGGIMASLYSGSPDGEMTFDLSLEINRKLQAVLEDTLLKNITLKENLETLGDEIARLTRELQALK